MRPRSYEAYRAAKMHRRGSVAESETDAESLASFSTWHSGSSHISPRNSSSPMPDYFRRTASSSSTSASLSPVYERRHDSTKADEREKRRQRREERAKRSTLRSDVYDSPLRRWLRTFSRNGLSTWSLPLGIASVVAVKTAVGTAGFSGKDSPLRYGDFEAQRHWMEVTLHAPIAEWYTHQADWWLLDYPPLTAYVSWICGYIGSRLNPAHFALDTSWGMSPPTLITYMRLSVLTLEGLFWWSAVIAWVVFQAGKSGRSWRSKVTGIMTVLLQPSLILIDNGHFQYNAVLLGLSLWTALALVSNHDVLACIAFTAALGFKQMGLYYAPAIGCYLIGKCIWLGPVAGWTHLVKLGVTTIASFTILFFPWLRPFPTALLHVLHRIFPFARGIFEDKVANFWCASNVVIKWRNWVTIAGMARLATIATLATLLPTILILLYASFSTRPLKPDHANPPPTSRLLLVAMFTSSLSFFLFSFQVHEKSILLPLMPLTVMMSLRGGKEGTEGENEIWEVGVLVNNVAVFSMWPLLQRDGQALAYVLATFFWNYAIGYTPWSVQQPLLRRGGYLVYALIAILHLPDVLPIQPPARYPDLWVVLNVLLSFGVYTLSWLWGTKMLIEGAWALGGLGK